MPQKSYETKKVRGRSETACNYKVRERRVYKSHHVINNVNDDNNTYLIRSSCTLRCRGCFFFPILIVLQTVGLLGQVISTSQGLYLNTE
jgi:hypothetical protein